MKKGYNLALSLNDTLPAKRAESMPVERKYPVQKIIELFEKKLPASRNRLTYEYVMRSDNISSADAGRLKKLFRNRRIKLNLIKLNGDHISFTPPSREQVERFINELEEKKVPVSLRNSAGEDIRGACGQLSGSAGYSARCCG